MKAARHLRFTCQRNTVLLTLNRELDEDAREAVCQETETVMQAVFEPSSVVFVVDFEGQPRCRTAGLLMLLGVLASHVGRGRGRIVICNPSDTLAQTLKRMRLDKFWPIFHTRADALASLEQPFFPAHATIHAPASS